MEGLSSAFNFGVEIKLTSIRVVNFIAGNAVLLFLNVMIEVERIEEAPWIVVPGLPRPPDDPGRASTRTPKDLTQ